VVKSCLPMLDRRVEKGWHCLFLRLVLFRLVLPRLQPGVVGPFPVMRCMVSQSLAAGGN
jgi:hypothetical protein